MEMGLTWKDFKDLVSIRLDEMGIDEETAEIGLIDLHQIKKGQDLLIKVIEDEDGVEYLWILE